MVKVSINEDSNIVSVSTIPTSDNISVSSKNKSVAVSMTNSEAQYYSDVSKQSADSAIESANSAKQYSEVAQTCSKELQTNWTETDSNSQAYIQNKPNTTYIAGDGISIENNVVSNTNISAIWGNIDGDITTQTDLKTSMDLKADKDFSNITDPAKVVITSMAANKDLSNLSDAGNGKLKIIGAVVSVMCTASYIPDGCLPCDGAEYAFSQFSSLVTNYLTSSPAKLLTCSYTAYANSITTYGSCSKFAIDTTTQKFKTPTIKDGSFIQQAKSDSELGKSYNAGLPNITGTASTYPTIGLIQAAGSVTGAFVKGAVKTQYWAGASGSANDLSLDASQSSSIYGNSTTVQPNAVALRYFVVVANGTLNSSQMDWSNWATSLAGKANNTLDNLSSPGKIAIAHNAMPSDIYSALVWASGSNYTAPADGYFSIITTHNNVTTNINAYINVYTSTGVLLSRYNCGGVGILLGGIQIPIKKGQYISVYSQASVLVNLFYFIYAEGSKP